MHTRTYDRFWLCSLTVEQRARTCAYWYTVTTHGGTPHTAFRRRESLLRWLAARGLTVDGEIPEPGTWSCQRINGTYRTAMHMDSVAFDVLDGVHSRTLSNGDYVVAKITKDADGLHTVHTLNPNVRERHVFDYQESEKFYA